MKTNETRDFNFEVRKVDGQPNVLRGYAAVFNRESLDLGGFVEVIRKGAFASSLAGSGDILALAQHDTSRPLARRSAGTLKVEEDDTGLLVEIKLSDTTHAQDIRKDVESENIKGMSFGFSTRKAAWTVNRGTGIPDLRELLDVELFEVSPVTMPAYPDTTVALRSKPQAEPTKPANKPEDMKRLESLRIRILSLPTH